MKTRTRLFQLVDSDNDNVALFCADVSEMEMSNDVVVATIQNAFSESEGSEDVISSAITTTDSLTKSLYISSEDVISSAIDKLEKLNIFRAFVEEIIQIKVI